VAPAIPGTTNLRPWRSFFFTLEAVPKFARWVFSCYACVRLQIGSSCEIGVKLATKPGTIKQVGSRTRLPDSCVSLLREVFRLFPSSVRQRTLFSDLLAVQNVEMRRVWTQLYERDVQFRNATPILSYEVASVNVYEWLNVARRLLHQINQGQFS